MNNFGLTLIYGIPTLIFIFYVVKRLISKAYHRGWLDGFSDAIVINETGDEVCEELAEIISKEESAQ